MKLLIIAGDMMMSIFANLEKMGPGPIYSLGQKQRVF
jgi:hypothetical protein